MSANMLQTIANVPLQPVHVVWYCICQIWFTLWDAFEGKHCYPISAAPFAKSMFVSGQTTFVLQSHGKVRQSKKTFPWTQRTPLKRQFVERTAAWFWSHWWMVPKTNHLFVCKKNANKSCSCPPVINPMRLHEREQIKFEDRFHTFWNRTFAIQTPLWFPNGTANRFEFWENLAEH